MKRVQVLQMINFTTRTNNSNRFLFANFYLAKYFKFGNLSKFAIYFIQRSLKLNTLSWEVYLNWWMLEILLNKCPLRGISSTEL